MPGCFFRRGQSGLYGLFPAHDQENNVKKAENKMLTTSSQNGIEVKRLVFFPCAEQETLCDRSKNIPGMEMQNRLLNGINHNYRRRKSTL